MIYGNPRKAPVNYGLLWALFFLYTALSAIVIQFVLLPHVIPQAHLGHGLFVFDSGGYHQIAAKKAAEIASRGWMTWELRPGGHSPAGIASFFYSIWVPEPYALIPFNAIIHATAGCLVFFLLNTFISSGFVSACGAALFVMNPAAFEWTAQIHKDGIFILGNLLVLTAWVFLMRSSEYKDWRGFIISPVMTLIGGFLIWVSRPYWNQVSIFMSSVLLCFLFLFWIPGWAKGSNPRSFRFVGLFLGCAMVAMQIPFVDPNLSLIREAEYIQSVTAWTASHSATETNVTENINLDLQSGQDAVSRDGLNTVSGNLQPASSSAPLISGRPEGNDIKWIHNPYLPRILDSRLYSLSFFRRVTGSQGGKTLLDRHIIFNSISDMMSYLPRAMQIGFLSPFPNIWMGRGSIPVNTIGRMVMGGVMAVSYLCWPFLLMSLTVYGRKLELWMVLIFSTLGLLVFIYAYPNVGTMNRMRYGFFSLLMVIGFCYALQKFMKRRQKKTSLCSERTEKVTP